MSTEQPEIPPPPPAPAEAPVPKGLGPWAMWRLQELARGILRAFGRAAGARAFGVKRHAFVELTRKAIIRPTTETVDQIRDMVANARKLADQDPEMELFAEVPHEQIDHWIRNARWAWVMQVGMGLLSALVAAKGALTPGFLGGNMMLGGILMAAFAISSSLRVAKDVLIFRTRRAVSFRQFWDDIEHHWNPLPRSHPAYWPVMAGLLPATLATLAATPVMMVLS